MRIGIDYTAAIRQGGGIGRYTREIVRALVAEESTHTYAIMAGIAGKRSQWAAECDNLYKLAHQPKNLSFHSLPLSDDWMARIWQRLNLPIPAETFTRHVDMFYSPDFVLPPLRKGTRSLLTIHDLSYLRHPKTFPAKLRKYLTEVVPPSVARADHIIAVSENTKNDLVELMDVPEDKISVVYEGVSKRFNPSGDPSEWKNITDKYDLGKTPYILALGTVQPRKNYVRLMQALEPITARMQVQLVIAGRPAWLSEPILREADKHDFVQLISYVDDADVPALYRQAEIFAFPSLYEGFGLPPLEAMACGTPVVASNSSSIPEVVGNAAIKVDPTDVDGWTEALTLLLTRSNEKQYYRATGLTQAHKFTWQRSAQQWLEIVANLLS